jgi:hypothetical protein
MCQVAELHGASVLAQTEVRRPAALRYPPAHGCADQQPEGHRLRAVAHGLR